MGTPAVFGVVVCVFLLCIPSVSVLEAYLYMHVLRFDMKLGQLFVTENMCVCLANNSIKLIRHALVAFI